MKDKIVAILAWGFIFLGAYCTHYAFTKSPRLQFDYSKPEAIQAGFDNVWISMQEKWKVTDSTPSLEDCEEGNVIVVLSTATGSGTAFTRIADTRYFWTFTKLP